jgi:peptide/nickel transport system permease protein
VPVAKFLSRKALSAVAILLAIAMLNFFLLRLAPGDPAQVMAGEAGVGDPIFMQQLREKFGLDRPLLEQFWLYIKGIATLDLGFSYRQQRPVLDLIVERLPATLLLTGAALVISLGVGVTLGVVAARRVGRVSDSIITTTSLVFYAMPLFWLALVAQIVFSKHLGWLPNVGYESLGAGYVGLRRALDIGWHLIMPATTLGLFFTAVYARMMRVSMLEVASFDYIKTAYAKGMGPGEVVRRHMMPNAILPVVTLAGLQAGQLVGGSLLVETVFGWPGIGRLLFDALLQRDYQVLLGVFFTCSAMVILFNILTDVMYRFVDPRIEVAS